MVCQGTIGPLKAEDQLLVFKRFAEASGQAFSILLPNARIVYISPTLCRLLGEERPEDTYCKEIFAFYPPDVAQELKDEILPAVLRDGQWVGELSLVDRLGNMIATEDSLFLIHDDKGNPLYIGNIITEITGRKRMEDDIRTYRDHLAELGKSNVRLQQEIIKHQRTEEELKTNEAALRSLLEATPAGVGLLKQRLFYAVNKALCRITGYSEQEMLGQTTRMLYPDEEEFERVGRELYGKMEREGLGMLEARLRHKEGAIIIVILCLSPFDPRDLSAGVCATVLDITERKKIEKQLQASEQMFRSIVENSYAGIYVADENFRFSYVNDKICEIAGYTREELLGMDLRQLIAEESMPIVADRYVRRQRGEDVPSWYEFTGVRKNGEKGFLETSATVVKDSAGQVRTVGQILDITERKLAEQGKALLEEQLRQSQKMESIGRLAGGVAHDFNNLLTAISGNTELALMKLDRNDSIYSRLLVVMEASKSAAALTQQLLAFSRKQIIEPQIINLNDLIDRLHKMLVRMIGENIHLRTVTQPGLFSVKVDPGQIEQIILNLAVNARDALPDGGLLIIETANVMLEDSYCQRHADALPGEHVMLTVSDNGTGMNPEVKAHLFEPFFTTKAPGMGTGLGLATVYGAVKQNMGTIEVYSEPGQGTSFKIYFPRNTQDVVPLIKDIATADLLTGSETILLVEDNPLVLEFSRSVLDLLGYNVLSATTGEEALTRAMNHNGTIHLLLTDVILPGINGRILADKLKVARPELKILFASGYTENLIVTKGVLEQGLHFIGKPFGAHSLARKIRELLDTA